jgi:hypothetical protein
MAFKFSGGLRGKSGKSKAAGFKKSDQISFNFDLGNDINNSGWARFTFSMDS